MSSMPGSHVWPLAAALLFTPLRASSAGLAIEDAIRAAWQKNPALAAGAQQVEAARSEAAAARDARWPTFTATAKAIGTDEPVAAFGLKLDQQKIAQADFAPDRLNAPSFIGGVGLGASIQQPIYMGGRLSAGRRAAEAQADAEAGSHERQRQEMALAVIEAYFGTQVAMQGLRYSEDVLGHARETERFVRARNAQGLMLDADVARATAFRAQAEAERASAQQRLASARSALVLLAGDDAATAELATPVDVVPNVPAAGEPLDLRPDLQAARFRRDAADDAVSATRAALLPQVFAQASVDTMRASLDQGATWVTLALVARWQLGLGDLRSTQAAQARAAAADSALRWKELQARREVDEARRAVETSLARVGSAREAVSASESARDLRIARHRQGLLPLTDVLDAEAGLAGARALLLKSQLEVRIARAQLELALGRPIEGVKS